MKNFTFASLFTGCGGADVGMKMAGGTHLWGIEREEKFAKFAIANGFNVIVSDIKDVDISTLEKPDVLWLSPPCQNYSVAKALSSNSAVHKDFDAGLYCLEYIALLSPKYIVIENVPTYRNSEIYKKLRTGLFNLSYFLSENIIKTQDLGIPQTRSRFIVRAVKIDQDFKVFKEIKYEYGPFTSWYDAIKSTVENFPGKKRPLTDVVINRIKRHHPNLLQAPNDPVMTTAIFEGENIRFKDEPSFTVTGFGLKVLHLDTLELEYLHPTAAAKIQSFPDDYLVPKASFYSLSKAIGNAVPPVLAQRVIESMIY